MIGNCIDTTDLRAVAGLCGLVRESLVGINSEVSYRLDHAPAGGRVQDEITRIRAVFAEKSCEASV
jgi:hypothetical protein